MIVVLLFSCCMTAACGIKYYWHYDSSVMAMTFVWSVDFIFIVQARIKKLIKEVDEAKLTSTEQLQFKTDE